MFCKSETGFIRCCSMILRLLEISDSLWFVICCLETFCKENDSWCICGTGKWTSITLCRVPEFDARGWFLFALVHRSFSFRVIQIRRSVQKPSSLGSPSADLFEREGFYFTDCSVIRFIDAQERLLLLCFYTGEASRLWWASVLLLSEPRQSVRAVRVPYRPSVFAPFCLKSAGLALIWASAVLLWFLALLYTRGRGLSIRRMHNELDIFFQ